MSQRERFVPAKIRRDHDAHVGRMANPRGFDKSPAYVGPRYTVERPKGLMTFGGPEVSRREATSQPDRLMLELEQRDIMAAAFRQTTKTGALIARPRITSRIVAPSGRIVAHCANRADIGPEIKPNLGDPRIDAPRSAPVRRVTNTRGKVVSMDYVRQSIELGRRQGITV